MIFSSFEFIYLFMPITLGGFLALRAIRSENGIINWLIACSLVFYASWNPAYLALLLASIALNYALHRLLVRLREAYFLHLGVALNLCAIGYFKYAGFFVDTSNTVLGTDYSIGAIILPLAISFFTFQQIAFLVETWRGNVAPTDFRRYVLFVTFFPQLIAGPIVMQKDTIPQFTLTTFSSKLSLNLSIGLSLFAIGLFKKLVIADTMAGYATPIFDLAEKGEGLDAALAWSAALAYTMQIYFDFSGYCDMALGLARCFGIRLPINFNSPYKAVSIIDFWRRWHITLSAFLRDYVYIPLGGNRNGPARRHANLLMTMLIGGLWHGAGWTFVFWGGLHGLYLIINHAWRIMRPGEAGAAERWTGRILTFLAVVVAWVFFRAESFDAAWAVLTAMAGGGDALSPMGVALRESTGECLILLAILFVVIWRTPNSIELTGQYRPALDWKTPTRPQIWRPSMRWSAGLACVAFLAITQMYRVGDLSEFIYFNF